MHSKKISLSSVIFSVVLGTGIVLSVLSVSGCGPNDNKYWYRANCKAVFQYDSLPSADIAKVKYAFYGMYDDDIFVTDATEAYSLEQGTASKSQNIKVSGLNYKICAVSALYYDKNDKMIAVGHDMINWESDTTIIGDPDIHVMDKDDIISFTSYGSTGDQQVFKPDDWIGFRLVFTPHENAKNRYDLSPFAAFEKFNDIENEKVAVLAADKQFLPNGNVIAAANGIVEPIATLGPFDSYAINKPIYVTEQTVQSIELSPVDSDITVVDKTFGIASIVKKDANGEDIPNATLGKKTFEAEGIHGDLVMGVDEVPMKVIATYTNDSNKGPQPKNIDIINEVELTTTFSEGSGTPLLEAHQGTLVATGTVKENTCDRYKVIAKYGDITDTNDVIVSYTTSELCFAVYWGDLFYYSTGVVVYSETPQELYVVGSFRLTDWNGLSKDDQGYYRSKPFYIPESLVGKNEYPEAVAENEPLCEVDSFKRADDGSNKYEFYRSSAPNYQQHEVKVGDFKVKMPKFVPTIIYEL